MALVHIRVIKWSSSLGLRGNFSLNMKHSFKFNYRRRISVRHDQTPEDFMIRHLNALCAVLVVYSVWLWSKVNHNIKSLTFVLKSGQMNFTLEILEKNLTWTSEVHPILSLKLRLYSGVGRRRIGVEFDASSYSGVADKVNWTLLRILPRQHLRRRETQHQQILVCYHPCTSLQDWRLDIYFYVRLF